MTSTLAPNNERFRSRKSKSRWILFLIMCINLRSHKRKPTTEVQHTLEHCSPDTAKLASFLCFPRQLFMNRQVSVFWHRNNSNNNDKVNWVYTVIVCLWQTFIVNLDRIYNYNKWYTLKSCLYAFISFQLSSRRAIGLFLMQTGTTTAIRCTAVRETDVSRHLRGPLRHL